MLARLPHAQIQKDTSFAKDALLETVREFGLDRGNVQVHTSWGTYYIAHLFGDRDQAVLFSRRFPDDPAMLSYARAAADARGRGVLVVTRRLDKLDTGAVREVLGAPRAVHGFGDWWAVEYVR